MPHRKVRLDGSTYVADIPLKIAKNFGLQHRMTVNVTLENDAIVIRRIINKNEPPVKEGSCGGAINASK